MNTFAFCNVMFEMVLCCIEAHAWFGVSLLVFEFLYFLFVSFDVYHERFLYSVWLPRGGVKGKISKWMFAGCGRQWLEIIDGLPVRKGFTTLTFFIFFCVLMLYGNLVVSESLCVILTGISIQQFHPKKNNSKSFQGIGEFTEKFVCFIFGFGELFDFLTCVYSYAACWVLIWDICCRLKNLEQITALDELISLMISSFCIIFFFGFDRNTLNWIVSLFSALLCVVFFYSSSLMRNLVISLTVLNSWIFISFLLFFVYHYKPLVFRFYSPWLPLWGLAGKNDNGSW